MKTLAASFALIGICLAGCAPSTEAADDVGTDEGAVTTDDSTKALDALVTSINGYASADAWILEHSKKFTDDLDDRFFDTKVRCTKSDLNEATVRWVTRDRDGAKRIRKLGLTYSSWEGRVSVTSHETYHYDTDGHLRVVVLDREEEHATDEPFMKEVDAFNARVKKAHDAMPFVTGADKIASMNKALELRTSMRIVQYRLYFRTDGTLFAETVSEDLSHARALEFDAISQIPPTLYGDAHPANVLGTPYYTQLFPTPDYGFRPITTTPVAKAASMRGTLIAANPADPETSLAATPVCR